MKKFIITILLLMFSNPLFAAQRATLQSGTGEELGTAANPIIVSATGVVDTSGTPVDDDVAVFTDVDTVEGLNEAEFKALLNLEAGTDYYSVSAADSAIAAVISNTAYDATSWDGVTTIAGSKNAIRDYIELLKDGFLFLDQNDSPSVKGELLYDNTVAGLTDGAMAFYDGTRIRYIVDLHTLPSTDNYVVTYNSSTQLFEMQPGGSASVAGDDTQVQFNDGSAMGADAGLTYNKTTDVLTVAGGVNVGASAIPGMVALDSGAPGADKEVGKIYWNYVDGGDGGDGVENADSHWQAMQGGSQVDILVFDESDDQIETTKNINTTGTLIAATAQVPKTVSIKVIADDTAVTTGDGKMYFTVPPAITGYNLTDADVAIYTASTSGTPTFQIHNLTDASDMLSTRITIDAEVAATGSVELTGGTEGSVNSVAVNSVTVTSGAVAFDTNLGTTATNLASNITAHTSDPNYTASATGAVVTITAVTLGSGSNGYVVASSTTTITTTDTNMSGGTTEYNSYTAATAPVIDAGEDDVVTGDRLRFDCDVAGTGTKGAEFILQFTKP